MLAIIGGLGAAAAWAVSSLCSSRSSRLIEPLAVVGGMMLVGLLITGPIALAEGVPARLHGSTWLWLLLSGGGNVAGLQLGYMAYRTGQVSLVVPIVSTEGAVAAVIALLAGESIGAGTGVALALAVIGVCLTSVPGDALTSVPGDALTSVPGDALASVPGEAATLPAATPHLRTVLLAVTAALVFGMSLYATGRAAAVLPSAWVVLSARLIGSVVLALPLALRGRLKLTRRAAPFVLASGIAEVVGFFSYSMGTRHGIAVAAVIASQFAAISVAFAFFFFGERLTRVQFAGICTILVGVSLLSALNT